MKRCADTGRFTPELGARLRSLRERAGLTQAQLMARAGRTGKGAAALASRLECGRVPYPSFGFVADYLRGCGAGFSDLLDLLEPLTALPPEPGPTVQPSQIAMTEQPEARQHRLEAFRNAILESRPLQETLEQLVDSHGWELKPAQRKWLVKTARGICRAHWRWPKRKRRHWERRVDRGVAACAKKRIDPAKVQVLGEEIYEVLKALEDTLVYSRSATLVSLGKATVKEKLWDERRTRLDHARRMKAYVQSQVQRAAHETLEPLVAEGFVLKRLSGAARIIAAIAAEPELDLELRRRMIADYAATWKSRPEQAIKAGEAALAAWEKYKVMIPPDPDAGS
jgi:transcriptional regulator with XRE-family HTH domain